MTKNTLIELLEKKLVNLSQLKNSAEALGDVNQVLTIDLEIEETQTTVNQLKLL
jgi:hypothetical protein